MLCTIYTSQTDLFCIIFDFEVTYFTIYKDYLLINMCRRGEKKKKSQIL